MVFEYGVRLLEQEFLWGGKKVNNLNELITRIKRRSYRHNLKYAVLAFIDENYIQAAYYLGLAHNEGQTVAEMLWVRDCLDVVYYEDYYAKEKLER